LFIKVVIGYFQQSDKVGTCGVYIDVFNRLGVAIVDEGIVMENMVEWIKMKGFLGGVWGWQIFVHQIPQIKEFFGGRVG
jgi:hypothetical protein